MLLAALLLCCGTALCVLSYRLDAGKTLLFCPQFRLTGLYCPGCGSMRALGHLLHGRLGEAFTANPLSTLLMPPLFALLLRWLIGYAATGRDIVLYRVPAWLCYAVLAALFLFGILRNIPSPLFDCLRPIG